MSLGWWARHVLGGVRVKSLGWWARHVLGGVRAMSWLFVMCMSCPVGALRTDSVAADTSPPSHSQLTLVPCTIAADASLRPVQAGPGKATPWLGAHLQAQR